MQIQTKRSLDELADMDLLSFNSLFGSLCRLRASERIEAVWSQAVAANGTTETIKDWIQKQWGEALESAQGPTIDLQGLMAANGPGQQ